MTGLSIVAFGDEVKGEPWLSNGSLWGVRSVALCGWAGAKALRPRVVMIHYGTPDVGRDAARVEWLRIGPPATAGWY